MIGEDEDEESWPSPESSVLKAGREGEWGEDAAGEALPGHLRGGGVRACSSRRGGAGRPPSPRRGGHEQTAGFEARGPVHGSVIRHSCSWCDDWEKHSEEAPDPNCCTLCAFSNVQTFLH